MAEGKSIVNELRKTEMKDIVIIGAGHLCLDAYNLIQRINSVTPIWNVVGFLNDVPSEILKYTDKSVIGTIKGWVPREGEYYALAIGSTYAKERIAEEFKAKGAQFPVLISPDAIVGAGSVVIAKVKPNTKVFGAPAKRVDF